jgi:ADP-ribosyl-[dinitrogen reductase] hydrolase
MTRAVAASLVDCAGHDAADQMQRYSDIIRGAPGDDAGVAAANLSPDFKRAVATWQWSRKPYAGTHDPKNLDPHSLARSLAVALYSHAQPAAALELAVEVSSTTQQSPVVLDAVRIWTGLMIAALSGLDKTQLLDLQQGASLELARRRTLRKELNPLLEGRWSGFATDDAGAVALIAQVLLALRSAANFAPGMRQLLGSVAALSVTAVPAAAAAALYGALAGAHFGVDAIPSYWQRTLPQAQALRELARRFGS